MTENAENPKARRARYLAKATAAEMNAATAETPEVKNVWFEVTEVWRSLAKGRSAQRSADLKGTRTMLFCHLRSRFCDAHLLFPYPRR